MNLRTFIPPPATAVAEPPPIGAPAPRLVGADAAGHPSVIAFLRHTGCPFAEATLVAMRRRAADRPELEWVAVSHAPRAATDAWCGAVGGAGAVRLVVDSDRSAYGDWGLGRTSLGHFLGRRSLGAVGRLARRGVRNRHPDGSRWQQAGSFALDAERVVRWRHLARHAGDLPDFDAALAALAERAGGRG